MSAGRLRHRVTIQRRIETRDPITGATSYGWADVATLWGAVEPLSAREFIAAQAAHSQVSARITIRFRDDITAAMRVLHGATAYDIEGVIPDARSGREWLTLPVSTGVRDGA
ncbi:MAG: head-tail adaptor protein [Burkholderiales bacterium 70-64]|nr:MAG: head-tail adaptor protein [Burkholderiales bacterium 70-64]